MSWAVAHGLSPESRPPRAGPSHLSPLTGVGMGMSTPRLPGPESSIAFEGVGVRSHLSIARARACPRGSIRAVALPLLSAPARPSD